MPELKIKDIVDLSESGIDEPESRIQKVFEWRIERFSLLTKWIFGFSGSLAIALFIGMTKDDIQLWNWEFWSLSTSSLAVLFVGLIRIRMSAQFSSQYLKSLYLLGKLKKIEGFLSEYRKRGS